MTCLCISKLTSIGSDYICISKLTSIVSDNGLLSGRRQAIIWTIAGILLIGPLGTNFSEIFIKIHTFSFKKMHLKMSARKWFWFFSCKHGYEFGLKISVAMGMALKTQATHPLSTNFNGLHPDTIYIYNIYICIWPGTPSNGHQATCPIEPCPCVHNEH